MKANEILSVLNHFKDSSYQRVLINGTWGIGKTKYVTDFKNEYSNSCYVSLFGKKDIESITKEIYFQIIEDSPIKKHASTLREKMKNLDISLYGFSLSIPVIEDIQISLNKELGGKETFIIIFDDLERKHEDLGIKEILGLLDSLSKIPNIKTVLIASVDQLKDDDETTFNDYQEKAIDRTYTIEGYADEAPAKILGEQAWNSIAKIAEEFKFKNLRTFDKISLFIKEVVDVLGEDIFSDKFTKDDLNKMCFATIIFNIEHQGEMVFLEENGDKANIINAFYTEDESGAIQYLCDYILKTPLDNFHKSVFHQINNWYKTGTYSRGNILTLIDSINKYEKNKPLFYSTEQEIHDVIDQSREYIRNLNGTEGIEDIVTNLNTAFVWCEILSIDFGISYVEILDMVNTNISNSIDIEKTISENELDLWHLHTFESEDAKMVFHSVNEALKVEYFDQLIKRINDCFIQKSYNEYSYLRQIIDSIISISDISIKERILKSISDNKFFFPIPSGQITEDLWNWCHLIIKLIATINQNWAIENYYDDFKAYIYSLEITKEDKMLQHRLKQLF